MKIVTYIKPDGTQHVGEWREDGIYAFTSVHSLQHFIERHDR